MARTEPVNSMIARLNDDIKNHTFSHVYVLYGDEVYLRDQFKENLKKALMPENPSMNYSSFQGGKIDPQAVCQMAETMPFLSDHRLILIEDSSFFKSASDPMVHLLDSTPETVNLIFCEDMVDRRGRMYKTAAKAGSVCEFTTPDEKTLRRWLMQSAKRGGHLMKESAAQLMINWCGHDMFCLHNEIEKLISYCAKDTEITEQQIKEICSRQLKDTIFQLSSAIALRKREDAFAAYRDLIGLETKPNQILYMLRREFKLVWLTKAFVHQGETQQETARRVGIHPAFIGRYIKAQESFSEVQLRAITDELAEIQARIHTGRAEARNALESFMMKHTQS